MICRESPGGEANPLCFVEPAAPAELGWSCLRSSGAPGSGAASAFVLRPTAGWGYHKSEQAPLYVHAVQVKIHSSDKNRNHQRHIRSRREEKAKQPVLLLVCGIAWLWVNQTYNFSCSSLQSLSLSTQPFPLQKSTLAFLRFKYCVLGT